MKIEPAKTIHRSSKHRYSVLHAPGSSDEGRFPVSEFAPDDFLKFSSYSSQASLGRDLESIEIKLLLDGIQEHYGFDFREYAPQSLKRRIWNCVLKEGLQTVSELQAKLLHDKEVMERFLRMLSVSVTSMFRDPGFYFEFRKKVVPILKTYPFVRIWHAGCASGEEVYSMAILLEEEGFLEKTVLYATDMNEVVLKKAKDGIFSLDGMKEYTANYIKAGGQENFSKYYSAKYDHAIFKSKLKKQMVFARHNLVTEGSFNEFNVILCRNVMIYFNQDLQNRVQKLLHESLCRFGILGLGQKETVRFSPYEGEYDPLSEKEKIYKRRN